MRTGRMAEQEARRQAAAFLARPAHRHGCARSGRIVGATLTDHSVDDAFQVGPLLDQVCETMAAVTGDGAYDRTGVYASVQERHPEALVVAPPHRGAVLSDTARCRGKPYGALEGRSRQRTPLPYRPGARHRGRRWRRGPQPHARPRTPELRPRHLINGRPGAISCSSRLDATGRPGNAIATSGVSIVRHDRLSEPKRGALLPPARSSVQHATSRGNLSS